MCLSARWTTALQPCRDRSLPVNVPLGELGNGQFGFVSAAMGSGTSRGKKVAPARVDQVTSFKTSSKPLDRPLQAPKIHAVLRNARGNCAPPDRRSEGRDSGSSGEDDDGGRDAVPERREWVSARKVTARKSSKTYGLCHSRRDDEDSGPEEPPAPRGANKRRNEAVPEHQLQSSSRGFLTTEVLLKDVAPAHQQPTFGGCHSSPVPMPIILYDGSEEELMDTIEKEFS